MKTNRLSPQLSLALNQQVTLEAESSQIYLMLACWADKAHMAGVKQFLMHHSVEERLHMAKVIEYIQERGAEVKIEAISAPPKEPKNALECFQMVYEQEVKNTEAIYEIANLAFEQKDWASWNFLQWLIAEQREEEKLALEILDLLQLAGGSKATPAALFEVDKAIRNTSQDAPIADHMNPFK